MAFALTGVWTGAGSDGKWTNADNWKDGVVPGRITVSSVLSGQGGDIAEFGAVAAGARTTVDLTGVTSIGGIKVVGEDAPAYTFGTSSQILGFEADGAGMLVGVGVTNAPTIAGKYRTVCVTNTTPVLTICNASTGCVLNLPSATDSVKDADYTGSITLSYIDFRGAGDIRIGKTEGYAYRDFGWYLNQTGKLVIGTSLAGGYGKYTPMVIAAGSAPSAAGQPARIEVEQDVVVSGSTQWGPSFNVGDSDVEISGAGTWGFNWRPGYDAGDARVRIATGRKLAITCTYKASCDKGYVPGIRGYKGNGEDSKWYGGDWAFNNANNEISGPLQNFFGNMETDRAGGFGTGEIQLAESSILRYTGASDWTMAQGICVTNWPSRTGLSGKIEVAGEGIWTLAGGLVQHNSSNSGTGTFTFQGAGTGVVSGVIANGDGSRVTAIAKSGTGTWTLEGANTFTGGTTVNAGTLKVAAMSSLATSKGLGLKGGTALFVGGETAVVTQELKKLDVTTANSTLELTGKVVVKTADFAADTGLKLNIVTKSPDAKLIVPTDKPTTVKTEKFTWNGQPVVFGADGEVKIDADAIIAARGDTVPDNGGKVAIRWDGTTGDDTLAAATTTLTKLTQMSETAATVAIGEGRRLVTPSVALTAGAADLALGAADDEGLLDSATKVISFDNRSAEAKIVLNAQFASGVTNELAYGRVGICRDLTLGYTKIAIVDQAKAQLDVRGCTVETGIEPIQIGANTGNDYNNGGMQYGELTVSNALIRNVADLARSTHSYSAPNDYGLLVGKNAGGILRVQDGAVISNKIQIGTGIAGTSGRGTGAVYQSGGRVVTIGSAEYRHNAMAAGGSAVGYYELARGTFEGSMAIAAYGYGIWHQEPGTESSLKSLEVAPGNGGHADVYVRGTMRAASASSQICGGHQNGNLSVVTVDGPGFIDMGGQAAYAFVSAAVGTNYVNVVRGGKVKVGNFYRHANAYGNRGLFDISFDGGVLVTGSDNQNEIFTSPDNNHAKSFVDHIHVYRGGMTIDTEGRTAGTKRPLQGPEGRGVVAIPFDFSSFPKWHVPPYVQISGNGTGATAHALYDSTSQMVTGVVITCSGVGYTSATATAVYSGNGKPSGISVACALADNDTTGSFTKAGAGTFTLGATNTWGGATIAKGGTLKAGCDWAVPTNSPVVLAGGSIDFNGKEGRVSHLTYMSGGGQILNAANVELPATFDMAISADEIFAGRPIVLSGDQDLTGKTLTVTGDFSSLDPDVCRRYTVVAVSNGTFSGKPTIVAPALPEGWAFATHPNGVKLVNPRGLMVIVR